MQVERLGYEHNQNSAPTTSNLLSFYWLHNGQIQKAYKSRMSLGYKAFTYWDYNKAYYMCNSMNFQRQRHIPEAPQAP